MVLIVAEHSAGKLRKSSIELVSAGTELAQALGTSAVGLVVGSDVSAVAEELAGYLSEVKLVDGPDFADVRAQALTEAVTEVAQQVGARAVLFSASRTGLSVSPRVAVRLKAPLLEDVTRVEADGQSVSATRLVYLSRAVERVRARSLPVVVSVKPNVYPLAGASGQGAVERVEVAAGEAAQKVNVVEKRKPEGGRVALEEAKTVVTGGRGVGDEAGFSSLVEPLVDALGGAVAATRAVVDAGWRPYAEQVGQTGKSVAPDLYIALGVSGAVQHLSGMNRSKVVVAINKDGDAPIFKASDYGIVGDVKEIVPALTEALREEG